jgi:hypothetical protein
MGTVRLGAMVLGLSLFGWGMALAGERYDLVDVAGAALFAALIVGSLSVVSAWAVRGGLGRELSLFVALFAILGCVLVGLAGPELDWVREYAPNSLAIIGGVLVVASTQGTRYKEVVEQRASVVCGFGSCRVAVVGGRVERLSIHSVFGRPTVDLRHAEINGLLEVRLSAWWSDVTILRGHHRLGRDRMAIRGSPTIEIPEQQAPVVLTGAVVRSAVVSEPATEQDRPDGRSAPPGTTALGVQRASG